MSYLTAEEKKMTNEEILLQVVLALQRCDTKGEAVKLLQEIQEIAVNKYKQRVRDAIETQFPTCEVDAHVGRVSCKPCLIAKELNL